MTEIRIIDEEHRRDINLPNEPFRMFGKIVPSYLEGRWSYEFVEYEPDRIAEMCFPDEKYDYYSMRESSVFVGAYDGDKCCGLAILQPGFFKYMYLYDLKVSSAYRGRHIGKALIEKAKKLAAEGIECEIVDPRTIVPLDKKTILDSVRKTGRLVVVTESVGTCGVAAEIAAMVGEDGLFELDAPVRRVCAKNSPIPFAPCCEADVLPSTDDIVRAVKEICGR